MPALGTPPWELRNSSETSAPDASRQVHALYEQYYCPCRTGQYRDESLSTLNELYIATVQQPNGPLHREIDLRLDNYRYRGSSHGWSLHILASCSHPKPPPGKLDVIRRMGEILIKKGYAINGFIRGTSSLMLAVRGNNLTMIKLLFENGAVTRNVWTVMGNCLQEHNGDVLELCLPHMTDLELDVRRVLVRHALRVHITAASF